MSIIPAPSDHVSQHPPIGSASDSLYKSGALIKKKKRSREDEIDIHNRNEDSNAKKKRKKPEKHNLANELSVVDLPLPVSLQSINSVPEKQKKSKKKDKGKRPESPQPIDPVLRQVDPSLTQLSEADASAAALISAIVTAAIGTSDSCPPQHVQTPMESLFQHHMAQDPSQHFMPYPFMSYGFSTGPDMSQSLMQSPSLFPPVPMNAPFSELTFTSNDDILRALQALDMSKITSVLKNLGEAMTAADDQPSTAIALQPTPLKQVPVASKAILSEQNAATIHRRTLDMAFPATEYHTSPDHAHLLATKWLNASKLSELVRTEGLVYKKGKFSAIEEHQLKIAIENYRITRSFTESQMQDLIFPKAGKDKDNAFWSEITTAVPHRPIIAVYHHVRRTYHPMKQQGRWKLEEDAALRQAVVDLGQQWEKVSQRVGRMSSDCRDRYRNHIINRDIRINGPWTEAEEDKLTRIVTDMTIKQGRDIDNDVFWGRVSELMGGKRGRQQCRIKWTDALSKTIKNEGQKPRWSQQDAYILVHKVDSLNVRDDTEIDWKTIPDPEWNLWSAHTLQRRWLTMKRGIKGYEDMTHSEIMDILRVKKAQLPAPPLTMVPRKRKERKVMSAAAVMEDPSVGVNTQPGSSYGRMTAANDSDSDNATSGAGEE